MVTFDRNPRFLDELKAQPSNQRVKREAAKAIVERAKIAAIVVTGDYRRSLRWYSTSEITAAVTTDFAGHLIEFGSVRNPAYAPLRGAALSVGMRYVGMPKASA